VRAERSPTSKPRFAGWPPSSAQGPPAHEVFARVAAEAGSLLDVHGIRIGRYEGEAELVHVAEGSQPGHDPPPYDRAKLEGTSVASEVLHTGRAARIDNYEEVAARAASLGARI
jgi:hypothetical protein